MARRKSPLAIGAGSRDDFRLVDADFGDENNARIEQWVFDYLESLMNSHRDLHQTRIPKWRKLYLGKPNEETRSYPWPNASNVVAQVIGDTCDTMSAREIGYVFGTSPAWTVRYIGGHGDPAQNEAKRRALETFLDAEALSPDALNLYEQYSRWCLDGNKLGTAFIKPIYEHRVEAETVGYDERAKKPTFRLSTIYQGPLAQKVRHEDVLTDAAAPEISKAKMVAVRRILTRLELEERGALGFYDRAAVDRILASPDRPGEPQQTQEELRDKGVNQVQTSVNATWDIWECWFPWFTAGKTFRLVYWVHASTKTVMRKVFNFMPWNETGLVRYKMGYATDTMYGHGYAELMEGYQEAISSTINNRIDNSTVANTRFFRISPQLRNLDANFEIMPMGMVPADQGQFEAVQVGDVYPSSFQNEESLLRLAANRAGIAPAVAGMGAGTTGKTKGVFSANATMSLMQAGNTRTNHVTANFRHAHVRLGTILAGMFGKFPGAEEKAGRLGLSGPALIEALDEFLEKKAFIPIRSSDASVNREVDKQNDMLIVSLLQRHYTAIGQMIQAVSNPTIPAELKGYLSKVIPSLDAFTMRILRDFEYDQPEEFIPKPELPAENAAGVGPALPLAAQQPGLSPVPGAPIGAGPGMGPASGGPQGIPPSLPGAPGGVA